LCGGECGWNKRADRDHDREHEGITFRHWSSSGLGRTQSFC
jgi:hypothetical protein